MNAVVLSSGGLDSTVLLYDVIEKGYTPVSLSFDYGQKHRKELDCAENIANKLGVEHLEFNLSFFSRLGSASALLDYDIPMPAEHYTHRNQRVTVVPNRNMVLLSIAVSLAEARGYRYVFYGAHANDRAIYPDCREEFIRSMVVAIRKGTYNEIELVAPFSPLLKSDIVRRGDELGIPWSSTWSCYEGGDIHCGVCATCQERKEAFRVAGVSDEVVFNE